MQIGYARVSTKEQSFDLQVDALRKIGGSVAKNDDGERRRGYRSSQIAASPKFLSIRRTSPMIPS